MKKFILISLLLSVSIEIQYLHAQSFSVSLKAFLEGPYNGTSMGTSLNSGNYLPLSQPYNIPPWNYYGSEAVPSIPNTAVVDWVLIELRETAGDASTAYAGNMVALQAGFILSNGTIVSTDGINPLMFNLAVSFKLFAIIRHHNHLAVMSANELVNSGGQYNYDFSTAAQQVYGGLTAHKEIAPGIWGLVSGDGNGDRQVNNADKNEVWKLQAGSSGFLAGDFNMNGQVNNEDKIEYWSVNSGRSSQLPEEWECSKPFTDTRDGQIYNTVVIGTQCWMAENLNLGVMIPANIDMANNGIFEKFCYDNNMANCDVYGGLYQWNEMMQWIETENAQGICEDGWHIPAYAEWAMLTSSLGGEAVAGGKMKSTGTVEAGTGLWYAPNTGATNSSGFTGVPGGLGVWGGFSNLGFYGNFWSSTANNSSNAYFKYLDFASSFLFLYDYNKQGAFSVRCMKDPPNQAPNQLFDPNPVNGSTQITH